MPKPSIHNSPSQQNSNRPSSVSSQTSKPATPGEQRRTTSSSAANGKEGFVQVKLPTFQLGLQEVQNPTLLPSLPDPTLSSQESTPRKAHTLRAVLAPCREATPETYRKSHSGHNTVAPTTRPVLDPRSEIEIAGANYRCAQRTSWVPKISGTAAWSIDVNSIFLPSVSDPAQSLRESKPRKPEKSADDEPSGSLLSSVPNFFAWSPTSEVNETIISKSGSTRRPARWDMHLHEKLILKKVVSARDLTSRLGEIADSALERAQADPNYRKPDQLSEKMKSLGAACIKNTKYESEVRNFYKESIAPRCLAAAGALGFGTAGDFLKWQSKVYGQTQAKADGFLVVAVQGSDFLALPDISKRRIKLLEKWNLNVLAIWEFKSLAAGSKSTMDAILGLTSEESFSWTGCTSHDPCKSNRNDPVHHTTCRKTSPNSLLPLIGSQPNVAKSFQAKRARVKPRHILQQAWAEAVQNDATFIVINAGLYEIIGFRHRASQTLHLSDVIDVSKSTPAYGKLHTGLYLAAFKDALDRAQQLDRMDVSGPGAIHLHRRK